MTYLEKYTKNNPKSLRHSDGTPSVCRNYYYGIHEPCSQKQDTMEYESINCSACQKCWNQEIPSEFKNDDLEELKYFCKYFKLNFKEAELTKQQKQYLSNKDILIELIIDKYVD